MTWIITDSGYAVISGGTQQSASTESSSRLTSQATKLIRIVRMVRLVRLLKLYKYTMQMIKKMRKSRKGQSKEVPPESRVGAAMAEITNRRWACIAIDLTTRHSHSHCESSRGATG